MGLIRGQCAEPFAPSNAMPDGVGFELLRLEQARAFGHVRVANGVQVVVQPADGLPWPRRRELSLDPRCSVRNVRGRYARSLQLCGLIVQRVVRVLYGANRGVGELS